MLAAVSTAPAQDRVAPARLPYRFNNFVWWTDAELREVLKHRIPNLQDQIPTTMQAESRIRTALLQILQQKGIAGEVMIEDPPPAALRSAPDAGVPPPAITFSMTSPRIFVDRIIISNAPAELQTRLYEYLKQREGRDYSSAEHWIVASTSAQELERRGYLDPKVEVGHDSPRRDGDHYTVNLMVNVIPGQQFHIAHVDADGGPLLAGRDLSKLVAGRPGDLATADAYGRLEGQLRAFYWHYGFADVEVVTTPTVDREHALVSYHIKVSPGPQYHLRTITVHGLTREQETRVRELFAAKPGDIFDETAMNNLYRTVRSEPLLKGFDFTFGPVKDKSAGAIDLRLDFSREGTDTHVTVN